MVLNTKIRRIIVSSLSDHSFSIILVAVILIVLLLVTIAYHFKSPKVLMMTTGFENGSYAHFGEQYRQILDREKIKLELLPSSGSIENLDRLKDKSSGVDAGFVQDGHPAGGREESCFPWSYRLFTILGFLSKRGSV